jgi:hypothetical protein
MCVCVWERERVSGFVFSSRGWVSSARIKIQNHMQYCMCCWACMCVLASVENFYIPPLGLFSTHCFWYNNNLMASCTRKIESHRPLRRTWAVWEMRIKRHWCRVELRYTLDSPKFEPKCNRESIRRLGPVRRGNKFLSKVGPSSYADIDKENLRPLLGTWLRCADLPQMLIFGYVRVAWYDSCPAYGKWKVVL